ncbi:hypothetical protein N7540_011309 [Penicillium herquei]|nr:hypothetical protein N7540_011309 [Penicillium herquei]
MQVRFEMYLWGVGPAGIDIMRDERTERANYRSTELSDGVESQEAPILCTKHKYVTHVQSVAQPLQLNRAGIRSSGEGDPPVSHPHTFGGKGDQSDYDHDTPVRPTQPRPDADKQNAPLNVEKEPPLVDVTEDEPYPRDLWKEAFEGLDDSCKQYVAVDGTSNMDAIEAVIKETTDKYEQWKKGGLKIHRTGGRDIDIRDKAERILGAAIQAKALISAVTSFDPTNYGGFFTYPDVTSAKKEDSIVCMIIQHNLDRRDAIFASSEYLSNILAYHTLIDVNYRKQGIPSDQHLDQALFRVYSAILEFTAEVNKANDENKMTRARKIIFSVDDQRLGQLKTSIENQSVIAERWRNLAANLGDRKRAAIHLAKADEAIERIKNVAVTTLSMEEERQLDWLSMATYWSRQRDLQSKRTANTGDWVFDSDEYKDWKSRPGGVLWLYGVSGCGKSVLCSTVVHEIEKECRQDCNTFLAYWYFQFGDDRTQILDAIIRSLIRQLSRSPLSPAVKKVWDDHHLQGSQPDSIKISEVLESVISGISGDIYIVIDALDEYEKTYSKERESLLSLMVGLLERHKSKIHILVTSRSERDIEKTLGDFPKLDLESAMVEDMKIYVHASISKDPLCQWRPEIQKLIVDKLLSMKERRFRWAELQIKELEDCYTESDIRETLQTIPQTVEESYQSILDRIKSKHMPLAREILMTVCFSTIALDIKAIAACVDLDRSDSVIQICTTSLVNLVEGKVQVAHFSVQEFLIVKEDSDKHHKCQFSATIGHKYLAEKTLDCLLQQVEVLSEEHAMMQPFLIYAANNWHTHVNYLGDLARLYPKLQDRIHRLFTEPNVYFNWVRIADTEFRTSRIESPWHKVPQECAPPLYQASRMGFTSIMDILLSQGADPSSEYRLLQDVPPTNSFVVAAKQGQLDALEFLLSTNFSLSQDVVGRLLENIDHRPAGKAKLEVILRMLWNKDLLREELSSASDTMKPELIMRAIKSVHSGLLMMNVFLDWRPEISVPIPKDLLSAAVQGDFPPRNLGPFLDRCNISLPSTLFDCDYDSIHGVAFLVQKRPNEVSLSNHLIEKFGLWGDSQTMQTLLRYRKQDFHVTQKVLKEAAGNGSCGMLSLLWPYRDPGVKVDNEMISDTAGNVPGAQEDLRFLLDRRDSDSPVSEEAALTVLEFCYDGVTTLKMLWDHMPPSLLVSTKLVNLIARHKNSVEMLELLISNPNFSLLVTDKLVENAAGNNPSVINYLAQHHNGPLPVTRNALLASMKFREDGDSLKILLHHAPDAALSDELFKSAFYNKGAMEVLLDQRRNPPVRKMLENIRTRHSKDTRILELLLKRNLVDVDEWVVETFAGDSKNLTVLLSHRPNAPITNKALLLATRDVVTMRLVMNANGNALTITEDIMVAATKSGEAVLKAILYRRGSLLVTEKVISAACTHGFRVVAWLLQQQPELILRDFWDEPWEDLELQEKTRCAMLFALRERTGCVITPSMLQELPYDPKSNNNYDLDEFVEASCAGRSVPLIPATEWAAEIVLKRCGQEAIELFFRCNSQILITENLIEAAKGNQFVDPELLISFLKRKREVTSSAVT